MEESALLEKVFHKERALKLDNVELINGIPIWRIVRFQTRLHYLNSLVGYVANTGSIKVVGQRKIKLFSGYWKYIFKKNLNLLFAFNKLVSNDGVYLDKFIDPVVEESFLKNENYVLTDPRNYTGNYPRLHKDCTISNEGRTVSRQILQRIMRVLVPMLYGTKIKSFFNLVKEEFILPDNMLYSYYRSCSSFIAEYFYYKFWIRLLNPQRVLLVYRESYFGLIAACKRYHIPVAEFQHGITLDNTVSFTGEYDSRIDPDYFLTFGNYWKGRHFGMVEERTFCIGWAYGKYMAAIAKTEQNNEDAILVISSPEISDYILDAVELLHKWNPSVKFHIRLHPCETYNEMQAERLSKIPQAEVVDNSNDSAKVLPQYNYVIGENSSVLYEALSLGCKVGLLNICGLRPPIDKIGIASSFSIIDNADDFIRFVNQNIYNTTRESFYSEFDNCKFELLLKQRMSL